MKVAIENTFTKLDGDTVQDSKGTVTLKRVCVNALLSQYESEKTVSGEDKLRRWDLAKSIHEAKETVELKSGDIELLKRLIPLCWGVVIVGQALPMLASRKTK